MEEVWDPNQIFKLFQKSGVVELNNTLNLQMVSYYFYNNLASVLFCSL